MSVQEEYWYMEIRLEILENKLVRNVTQADFDEWVSIKRRMSEYERNHEN